MNDQQLARAKQIQQEIIDLYIELYNLFGGRRRNEESHIDLCLKFSQFATIFMIADYLKSVPAAMKMVNYWASQYHERLQHVAEGGEAKYPNAVNSADLQQFLSFMPYRDYLQTAHWKEVRQAALDRAGNHCQVCNRNKHLDVHHRTYERRGAELPEDLTVLCRKCHSTFHKNGRLSADD